MSNSLAKALGILLAALAMLWIGASLGDDLSPLMIQLESEVAQARWTTWWIFVGVFIVAAAIALPVGALLSMAGGLLFGTGMGGLAGWSSTFIAAWLSFVVIRWWAGQTDAPMDRWPRLNAWVGHMNSHSTELVMLLRIVPLVPFYLINVAAAVSPMRLSRYTWASLVGLAPSTFLYAMIGHSLGSWMEAQQAWDSGQILTPSMISALVALGCLGVLSVWGTRRLASLKAQTHQSETAGKR